MNDIERDDKGRFTGMTSEMASEMGNRSVVARAQNRKDKIAELIRELGFDPKEAPPSVRLTAERYADKKDSPTQWTAFKKSLHKPDEKPTAHKECLHGENCPMCQAKKEGGSELMWDVIQKVYAVAFGEMR